jgi:hypothetical protein
LAKSQAVEVGMKSVRSCLAGVAGVVLASAMLIPVTPALGDSGKAQVKLDPIGNPTWIPVDLHVFAAPIGTAADNYAEFAKTMATVLPPPHYKFYSCLGIGPGTPEQPPYDHDIADGVTNAGYPEGHKFAPPQFSNGFGVYFSYMVVPTPNSQNVGSSPDFTGGPIIPNSLFPIHVVGVTLRNRTMYDPNLGDFNVPAITDPCVQPPFQVDGFSHFPVFTADNSDFGPSGTPLNGKYAYNVTMTDAAGKGWEISATFMVH